MDFVIRRAKPEDRGFIFRAWKESHHRSDEGRFLGPYYFATMKARIARVLDDSRTRVSTAHVVDNEDAILAMSVSRGDLLHYVYVREEARGFGIAKALIAPLGIKAYDHRPQRGASNIPADWAYLPELLTHAAA